LQGLKVPNEKYKVGVVGKALVKVFSRYLKYIGRKA